MPNKDAVVYLKKKKCKKNIFRKVLFHLYGISAKRRLDSLELFCLFGFISVILLIMYWISNIKNIIFANILL